VCDALAKVLPGQVVLLQDLTGCQFHAADGRVSVKTRAFVQFAVTVHKPCVNAFVSCGKVLTTSQRQTFAGDGWAAEQPASRHSTPSRKKHELRSTRTNTANQSESI